MSDDFWALPEDERGLFVDNRRRALSRMREEYIKSRVPFDHLAKHYGVAPSVLRRYADRGDWEGKRAAYSAKLFGDYVTASKMHDSAEAFLLKRIEDASLAILTRHLEMYARSGMPMGIDELKKVTEIFKETIKQIQLKKGEATNITGTKDYSKLSVDDVNAAIEEQRLSDRDILEDPIEQ